MTATSKTVSEPLDAAVILAELDGIRARVAVQSAAFDALVASAQSVLMSSEPVSDASGWLRIRSSRLDALEAAIVKAAES